jgi:hypothetical protein
MNFTLTERLQLLLALTVALTATLPGLVVAVVVLGRLALARGTEPVGRSATQG